jgi:hypothetical protein
MDSNERIQVVYTCNKRNDVDTCENVSGHKKLGRLRSFGGLGDRFRGLMGLKVFAKQVGFDFSIDWGDDGFDSLYEYPKYVHTLHDVEVFDFLQNQKTITYEIDNNLIQFTKKVNRIFICWFLKSMYNTDSSVIEQEFRNIYKTLFIPTEHLLNIVSTVIGEKNDLVGIQLRLGDRLMIKKRGGNRIQTDNSDSDDKVNQYILKILSNIKKHLELTNNNDNFIFITSDSCLVFEIACQVWSKEQILYNEEKIVHIDKNNDCSDGTIKTYVDHYILSRKTKVIYGSMKSGYSRTACLASNHSNFYNISEFVKDKKKKYRKSTINQIRYWR